MMPVRARPAPKNPALDVCIAHYRRRAEREDAGDVWKDFRKSKCGVAWFEELTKAYGHFCVYCEHAPGRNVDHAEAKRGHASQALSWSNFRPSCGDCNRLKGTRRVVDPLAEDPRSFIMYDTTTGRPHPLPSLVRARRAKWEATRPLLDHQALNEDRRRTLLRFVDTLVRFLAGEPSFDEVRVLDALAVSEPRRAILRELILGADDDLHQWSALTRAAMRRIPALKTWALSPLGNAPRRTRSSR